MGTGSGQGAKEVAASIDTVGSVRLRLPAVLARGGDPWHGPAATGAAANGGGRAVGDNAGVAGDHAPVLGTQEAERRQRVGGARAAAGGLLALYSRVAARGGRLARRLWWLPGWAFAAITQAPAVLALAWLIPGTAMLLAGRLLPLPMVIIFVPLAVALCYFAMRRLPVSWPRAGDPDEVAAAGRRRDVPAAALLAMVVIAAGFGVWQALLRSEQVFVVSDPGVYLQYGYWIAEHGMARIPVSAAAFGGSGGLDFATPGFVVSGSSITPGYLPGLPLVLAAGTWLGGLGGALLMPAVLGGCAVLSFAGLVGRLCGAWWGVAGELVLAICLPEVYASRTPFSEPLVQVLLFGGLCLFLDSLVVRRRGIGGPGRHGRPGRFDGELALAGLGGLALGLTVLASIGSLGMLLPAFPVVAVLFVARRPQAGPFGGGLIIGIAIGLAAGLALARPYLASESEQLHLIGLAAAAFGAVTALIAPLALPGAPARVRRACAVKLSFPWFKGERVVLPSLGFLLAGLALVLPVIVLAGLAVRPYLQTVRGQADPAVIRQVAALQRLERLPVDGTRQYFESSLSWVLWYLGVPAMLLACLGVTLLGRRLVRAVLEPRPAGPGGGSVSSDDGSGGLDDGSGSSDDGPGDSRGEGLWLWALPFLIIVWSVLTVLWDPAVIPWQPLASHRLVPVVLPGLLLFAVWASSRLTALAVELGASRTAVVLAGACCVLALAIPTLVTTLNPGLVAKASVGRYSSGAAKLLSRVRLRGVGARVTYGGSVSAASSLCVAIGPSASVLFVDEQLAETFAPVVRDLCGQPTAWMVPGATSKAELAQAVSLIEQLGRRPVLLGPSRAAVSLAGMTPRLAVSLSASGDAEVLTGPPAGTWPVTYSLWLTSPAGS
jgi:hypothetical protein